LPRSPKLLRAPLRARLRWPCGSLIASLHLALNAPNALFQEVVRAYYTGWYKELVTELAPASRRRAYAMTGPGLGTALLRA